MSDQRPAYGEYATPEEQQRRIAQNAVPGAAPAQAAPAPAPPAAPRHATPPAARPDAPADGRKPFLPALSGRRRVDRIFGFVFVLWGLLSVVQTMPQLTNLAAYIYDSFEVLGVDAELADPSGARGWGIAAAAVLGVAWLLTAVWSWRRARAGRIFFWVPIVGAVAGTVVVAFLISVPLAGDPALLQSIMDQMPQL
ncbi:DUF6264 family protein [Microbacterium halophytorum]|uniref:DUF6264 family protein n=1 Tax=Microbacterium halophytorum TaxID=2067568 RepID=UPI000CFCF62A|nr:DUF6264 family protein [Microbacterium halophytorum]